MGLFCNDNCQQRRACKSMCKAAFPGNAHLERGCVKACKHEPRPIDSQDYLENYVDEQTAILNLGIDPNQGNAYDVCSLPGAELRPECDPATGQQRQILYVFLALLILGLAAYFILKK